MADADLADLEERMRLLKLASRPKEPATEGREPTVQGHIISAISKLERAITKKRMG